MKKPSGPLDDLISVMPFKAIFQNGVNYSVRARIDGGTAVRADGSGFFFPIAGAPLLACDAKRG